MAKDLSCGVEFMRGLLLFLNILFVLVGLGLIGIGIYIKVDSNFSTILDKLTDLPGFSTQSLGFLAIVMIAGGVFTLLIALLGCMGSLWHSRCALYFYGIILLILMIIELVGFIMAFVYKANLQDAYQEPLYNVLRTALENNDTNTLAAFRDIENAMKCCGIHNGTDYSSYPYLPKSEYCNNYPNADGCSAAIIKFLEKNLPIVGGTLGGVLVLELFCLIAAFILARALKKNPDAQYSSKPGYVLGGLVSNRYRN